MPMGLMWEKNVTSRGLWRIIPFDSSLVCTVAFIHTSAFLSQLVVFIVVRTMHQGGQA